METVIDAEKDALTHCYLKASLLPFLTKLAAEYHVEKKPFTIFLVDIDHFKYFNERYGHVCGDEFLKHFSRSMRLSLEIVDNLIFRFGGDEFIIVLPSKTSKDIYHHGIRMQNIIRKKPLLLKKRLFKISFSGGIASYPKDAATPEELVNNADKAMYFAKRHGRNRIVRYDSIWLSWINWLISVVMALILISAAIFILDAYILDGYIKDRINKSRFKLPAIMKVKKEGEVTVYLKSGGAIKGRILRETNNLVEVSLDFDEGEGSTIITRSNILRIDKDTTNE